MNADVIIIGAGLAGLMSARAACVQGARVLLLTRKTVGLATNSALSNAVFAGPTRTYTPQDYIRDTLSIGKGLNSRPHVETVAREIAPAIDFLRTVGCNIVETHGHYMVQPARPDLIPGVTLMKTVAAGVKGLEGLEVKAGFHVLDILAREGRVCGVTGVDRAGDRVSLYAPAVVLAGGGAGALYQRNDNQKGALGQGYAMALRAGLELRDMEFVQFYPFVHAEPGIPPMLLYPPLPQAARLIDGAGRDLAERFGLGKLNDLILKKRDDLSALLHETLNTGPVYMDYRGVPVADWARPPLAMLEKLKFDFKSKPFAVAPAVHFCMGGIRTDADTRTTLPGLYACGEVAWGLHGANRRGGNALAECLVFGQIAGTRAAGWGRFHPIAAGAKLSNPSNHPAPGSDATHATLRALGKRLKEVAWHHAGIVRDEQGLQAGMSQLRAIEDDLKAAAPSSSDCINRQAGLIGACLVLRTIFAASLARRESIGSFKRRDFSEEANRSRFGNSCVRYDAQADRLAVTFTKDGDVH